ncbi:carboxypeptidase-like regulatory domain-containing protein [Cognatitamlana onchidii]|uniref:carboxypeptidase-like regulatory domain-containing protein n=1 Tax=Cognatitamlana onchidii TaxID=2562860 RepID=UPI0010A5D1B2|nr:carboxypeptidase-like regulatory domain-containing protein [Algibacter onchidii]
MKSNFLLFYFLVTIGFVSCSDSNDNNPDPPKPTAADISGTVNLYDEGINEIDNADMLVKVEGSSIAATTDAEGRFRLLNVPFGDVTLVYEKTGYGTFKKYDIEHNDGDTFITDSPSLGQKSTTSITNLVVSTGTGTVTVAATTDPVANIGNTRYIRYFFSTQSNVSSENFDAVLDAFPAQITPYNLNLNSDSFEALGFESGQTVYVKCYGESFWSNQYEDPDLNTTVFPNVNANSAAAVSFVVP